MNNEEVQDTLPVVEGSKGGSKKQHTPVETPNNIISTSYAKVLIAVGEGQLAGNPTGRDIYLDGTPLIGVDGSNNFGGVKWEWRDGSQNQTYIQGLPEASSEYPVGVELKSNAPWVRSITKSSLSAIRLTFAWNALLQQLSNGDTTGYSISYSIEVSTDGGPFVLYNNYTVSGKTNSGYERTHRVDLPVGSYWSIRAKKLTPDTSTGMIQDQMTIKSFTEVIDAKLRYPNTALLYVEFDSRLFPGGSIPKISVKTKGRIIRIPSNYDSDTRAYSGIWDGSFKWGYSNNPAWVFFDLVTQERFGLGGRVDITQIDKWVLYKVAQYCDVLVPDGMGGTEPRHTCNLYIQSKTEAWTVLRDIASIFNGMTYWDGQKVVAIADVPANLSAIKTFGRSEVVDGMFNYASTDERSIFTSAVISYDNPDNHYNTSTEAVWEKDQILRFGAARQTEISAIGCTSRGEAQRRGKYQLLTNLYNRIVTFKTGLQGFLPKPGDVIGVADPALAGRPFTGRLKSATTTVVTLDRDTQIIPGDVLFITKPDGKSESRPIVSYSNRVVQVSPAFSFVAAPDTTWYNEASDLKSQLYRVTKVTRPEEGMFEITGVEYNDSKYGAIDNGARLEERPISVVPTSNQLPPTPVTLTSFTYVEQGLAVTTMTIQWPQTVGAVLYEVEWSSNLSDWIVAGTTPSLSVDIKGIYSGNYRARVRAINPVGVKSLWEESVTTALVGKVGDPPAIPLFTTIPEVFAIRLNWAFPDGAEDTAYTEVQESVVPTGDNPVPLSLIAYPTKSYLKTGMAAAVVKYFRARLVDRTGNNGPWTTWIQGTSSADANEILDYIAGQITETELGQSLQTEIGKIPSIELQANKIPSIELQVSKIPDIEQDIITINNAITNFQDALVYDKNSAYLKGDIVRQGNKLYQALMPVPVDVSGAKTPPSIYWKDVGDILETANGLITKVDQNTASITDLESSAESVKNLDVRWRDDDGNGDLNDALGGYDTNASITEEKRVRADADSALAQTITTLQTQVGADISAAIQQEATARSNADGALSTLIDTVTAKANGNTSAIQAEATARANADTAIASSVTALQAKTTTDISAAIQDERTVRVSAEGALSTRIDTAQAKANGNTAAIQTEATARTNADTALASTITALETKTAGDISAAVSSEATARSNADGALGTRIDTAQSKANSNTALITAEQTTRANADTALATSITNLQAKTTNDISAAIQDERTVRVSAEGALSTRIDTTQAVANSKNKTYRQGTAPTVGIVTGDLWYDTSSNNQLRRYNGTSWLVTDDTRIATNTAAIQTEATARASADTAISNTVTTLQAKVDNDITAAISSEAMARANADGALSTRIDTTQASVGTNTSAIQAEATARVNADGALSTRIDTTQASVASKNRTYRQDEPPTNTPVGTLVAGDVWYDSNDGNKLYRWGGSAWVASDNVQIAQNTASVQQVTTAQATTDGKLGAMWSVKMQVNANGQYVAAGIGLGIENTETGLQSQFLVSADRFAVVNTLAGGGLVTPFVVQGGQVIMNSAIIGNATIGFAKINDDVQSTNYIAGVQGWRLQKDGNFEINGNVPGQGRLAIDNTKIVVYYSNGVPAVEMGILL